MARGWNAVRWDLRKHQALLLLGIHLLPAHLQLCLHQVLGKKVDICVSGGSQLSLLSLSWPPGTVMSGEHTQLCPRFNRVKGLSSLWLPEHVEYRSDMIWEIQGTGLCWAGTQQGFLLGGENWWII